MTELAVGDRIAIPPEPPVGTRLGPAGVDRDNPAVAALDVVHTEAGWYYAGHLNPDGSPKLGPGEDGEGNLMPELGAPIDPWDWHYVITTHRELIVVEVP